MKSAFLKFFAVFFFIGVASGSVLPWWGTVLLASGLWISSLLRGGLRWAGWVLFAFFFGFFRIWITFPDFDVFDIAFYRDTPQPLTIEGFIAAEPEIRNDAQYLLLSAKTLRFERDLSVSGPILLRVWRFPEYRYGDVLEVTGTLQKPAVFEEFSYAEYLAKDGIYSVMYQPRVELLSRPKSLDGWDLLFSLKAFIRSSVENLFPEPGASIVLGLLLGLRTSIPPSLLDDFQRSGLTHILAISGYNITLLITIVGLILKSCGRRLRFFATWMAIAFFALLTGLSASVVRASIMGALTVFTLSQGRKTDGMILLLMSGVCMVFANPRILVWDVSFQLSFVSTLGLMTIMPLWEEPLRSYPPFIRESLAVTLAATLFTTPVVLYHFGTFSLISPIANVIFLPLIPLIMFFSFLTILNSWILLPGTFLWMGVTWVFLWLLIEGVGLAADVPGAFVNFLRLPWWGVALYYAAVWILISSRIPKSGRCSPPQLSNVSLPPPTVRWGKSTK